MNGDDGDRMTGGEAPGDRRDREDFSGHHDREESGAQTGRESERSDESFHPDDDRLLLDAMLGKLATYLRMCGYDTAYVESEADPPDILERTDATDRDGAIRERAIREGRTLLTRDRELGTATPGAILLTERDVEDQLRELAGAGFTLELPDRPQRCAICNTPLAAVATEEPSPEYAPDPTAVECWRCPDCGQFFWRGSHWDDVAETLAAVRRSADTGR